MIFDGSLRRGERIRRDEIAERLGISPIPVREAIIALDREGWVTIEPHKGAYVLGIDVEYIRDHYELVADIWALVAEHAAEHSTSDQLRCLGQLADAIRDAGSDAEMAGANIHFMRELLAIGGSPSVASVLDLMTGIIPGCIFSDVADPAPCLPLIDRVMKCLQARCPNDAAEAIAELIRSFEADVLEVVSRRGITERPVDLPATTRIGNVSSEVASA